MPNRLNVDFYLGATRPPLGVLTWNRLLCMTVAFISNVTPFQMKSKHYFFLGLKCVKSRQSSKEFLQLQGSFVPLPAGIDGGNLIGAL